MNLSRIYAQIIIIILFIMNLGNAAGTPEPDFIPIYSPGLTLSRAVDNIRVDGDLNDAGWSKAAVAGNFVEHYPGDQTRPPVETKVFLTYDDDNLYVGFQCYDDPAKIRASYCERDKIFSDDNVKLCLDTYGNAAWAYIFYVNPYGIQGDAMWASSGGEQMGYDLIWESAGIVTDSGYQVEIAIPFMSMRFPNRAEQLWRVDLGRNHPRETLAEYSWAAYDRDENCWPCQWGTVDGISDVTPGRGIKIAPAVLGYQTGLLSGQGQIDSPYKFLNHNLDGELSVWGKYSISSNATAEVTVNPDFSQIEADAGQIDVNTTFTLFYPERRPFFQEGSDLFRAAVYTIYTRMINDPELAAKATFRSGDFSLGYLLARDKKTPIILPSEERSDYILAGKSTSNLVRIKNAVGEGSEIGLILTDQRFDGGGSGSSITHDAIFRIMPTLRARYHMTLSHVTELDDPELTNMIPYPDSTFDDKYTRAFDGESFWGYFTLGSITWWTKTWNASLQYQETSPAFRQHNGFFRQNNYRYIQTVIGYFFRIPDGIFETINPHIKAEREWYLTGKEHYKTLELNLWTRLRTAQAGFYSQYIRTAENFNNIQYDEIWHLYQDGSIQLGDLFQLEASVNYGHKIARLYSTMGKTLDVSIAAGLKPNRRLLLKQWLDYARATSLETGTVLYDGYIYRTRVDYQFSRPLTIRVILEYNDFQRQLAVDPLLTFRLNPFSVLYAGMTSVYQRLESANLDESTSYSTRLATRQFFMKLQYLFRL